MFKTPGTLLIETLANSAAFRAWVSAADVAEAKLRIYKVAAAADEVVRPYGFVDMGPNWRMEVRAGGSRNFFGDSGSLRLGFEADIPTDDKDDPGKALEDFTGTLETILIEMAQLAGTGGFLNITAFELVEGPVRAGRSERDDDDSEEDFWQVVFQIDWQGT